MSHNKTPKLLRRGSPTPSPSPGSPTFRSRRAAGWRDSTGASTVASRAWGPAAGILASTGALDAASKMADYHMEV